MSKRTRIKTMLSKSWLGQKVNRLKYRGKRHPWLKAQLKARRANKSDD